MDGQQELPTVAIHAARNSRCGAGGTSEETVCDGGDGFGVIGAGVTTGAVDGAGAVLSHSFGGGFGDEQPAINTARASADDLIFPFMLRHMRRGTEVFGNGFSPKKMPPRQSAGRREWIDFGSRSQADPKATCDIKERASDITGRFPHVQREAPTSQFGGVVDCIERQRARGAGRQ